MSPAHQEVMGKWRAVDGTKKGVKAHWPIGWMDRGLISSPDVKSKSTAQEQGGVSFPLNQTQRSNIVMESGGWMYACRQLTEK